MPVASEKVNWLRLGKLASIQSVIFPPVPSHWPNKGLPAHLTRAVSDLLRLAVVAAAIVENARVVGVGADILQGSGVPVVQVNADNFTTVVCGSALHVDIALALGVAVTAGAVDLAVVFGVEVDDLE